MERVHKRVPCTIEYVGLESDFVGLPVPGFIATCSRCRHQTESIGTTGIQHSPLFESDAGGMSLWRLE